MTLDHPCCRAAIRDGVITLNAWTPRLHRSGPVPAAVLTVDAALADLQMTDDGELIVTPVPHAPWDAAAEETLLGWARTVGYERVWLPGRVVALDGAYERLGVAAVCCPTCGACWADDSVEFWGYVLDRGVFPGRCLACGGSLPEWSLQEVPDASECRWDATGHA